MIVSQQFTVICFSGKLSLPPLSPMMFQYVQCRVCVVFSLMDAGPAPTAHYYNGSLYHFANLPLQWKCFQSFQKSSAFHNGSA